MAAERPPLLEIKTWWGDTLLDTFHVEDERYEVEPGETLRLPRGATTVVVREVRAMKLHAPPWSERLDYGWLNMFLIAFFVHAVGIVNLIATPLSEEDLTDELVRRSARVAVHRYVPAQPARHAGGAPGAGGHTQDRAAAPVRRAAPRTARHSERYAPDDGFQARASVNAMFSTEGRVFSHADDGGLSQALGGVTGGRSADPAGAGGMGPGLRGDGPGGEGPNTLKISELHDRRLSGGFSEGRVSPLKKSEGGDVDVDLDPPRIEDALDKSIIRSVIRSHIAQIRYCYEVELQRQPGLFGRISTELTIGADGRVARVSILHSTIDNRAVETCVVERMKSWVFPKPRGGGVVVVRYPFIFNRVG